MDEYILTEDEQGMLRATVTKYQTEMQTEVNAVLRSIARYRNLSGDGWRLDGTKLTRGIENVDL